MSNSFKDAFIERVGQHITENDGREPTDSEYDDIMSATRDDFLDAADQLRKRAKEEGHKP